MSIHESKLNDGGAHAQETVWQIKCDECGVAGPLEFRKRTMMDSARSEGWQVHTPKRHLCPDCTPRFPEHAKLRAVKDQSQMIGTFLDWLMHESEWTECASELPRIQLVLASYFGIDEDEIEREKRKMLDECRKTHKAEIVKA